MFVEAYLQQLRISKLKQSKHCECALIVAQAALQEFSNFSFGFGFSVCPRVTHNVLQLGEVADLEALTFNLALMFIRMPNVQFSTEPAILPNCCYGLGFLPYCQDVVRQICCSVANFLFVPNFVSAVINIQYVETCNT